MTAANAPAAEWAIDRFRPPAILCRRWAAFLRVSPGQTQGAAALALLPLSN